MQKSWRSLTNRFVSTHGLLVFITATQGTFDSNAHRTWLMRVIYVMVRGESSVKVVWHAAVDAMSRWSNRQTARFDTYRSNRTQCVYQRGNEAPLSEFCGQAAFEVGIPAGNDEAEDDDVQVQSDGHGAGRRGQYVMDVRRRATRPSLQRLLLLKTVKTPTRSSSPA